MIYGMASDIRYERPAVIFSALLATQSSDYQNTSF